MSDHHIQFLKEEFLPYCKIWEESVIARDGFSDSQKEMMLIAKESRTGLQISDTYVFNLNQIDVQKILLILSKYVALNSTKYVVLYIIL